MTDLIAKHRDILRTMRSWNLGNFYYRALLPSLSADNYTSLGQVLKTLGEFEHDPRPPHTFDDESFGGLVRDLEVCAPSAAGALKRFMSARVHEHRLQTLRESRPDAYFATLPEITAIDLADALAAGTIVNAVDWRTGEPAPIRSDEGVSGAFLEQPVPTAQVSARVLAEFLRRHSHSSADRRGLRLSQVLVTSEGADAEDWNGLELAFGLGFEGCAFPSSILADRMAAPNVTFDSCDFTASSDHTGFAATRARISRLSFFSCVGLSQLFLMDCEIGELRADVEFPEGARFMADGLLSQSVWVDDVAQLASLSLDSARVDGMSCSGAPSLPPPRSRRAG